MRSISVALAAAGVMAISTGNRGVIEELLPQKWISDATGNDKIRSGNTLSQKGRRQRKRQHNSQSFKKGSAA